MWFMTWPMESRTRMFRTSAGIPGDPELQPLGKVLETRASSRRMAPGTRRCPAEDRLVVAGDEVQAWCRCAGRERPQGTAER
jgi:hypothetical protein